MIDLNVLQLILVASGVLAAIHSICTANFMPKGVATSIALEIVCMFGFSVGAVVSSLNGEIDRSWSFMVITMIAKAVSVVDMMCRGYPPKFALVTCSLHLHDLHQLGTKKATTKED